MLDQAIAGLGQELKRMETTSDEQIALAAQNLSAISTRRPCRHDDEHHGVHIDGLLLNGQGHVCRRQAGHGGDRRWCAGQMRQSIIDLPDEAKASADAMRRVVSDQITALSALADVVRRHGDRVDLSGPGIRPIDGVN